MPDPAGLAADFAAMMETAMGKQVADVALRVWTPQHANVQFVKQVAPVVEDLTGRRAQCPQAGDYPTGAWGAGESRDYHLRVQVVPAAIGTGDAGRPGEPGGHHAVRPGGARPGEGPGHWTDDEALSTKINANVAHYTGQAELAQVIQEGLEARKAG